MQRRFQHLVGIAGIAKTSAVQLLAKLEGLDPEMSVRQVSILRPGKHKSQGRIHPVIGLLFALRARQFKTKLTHGNLQVRPGMSLLVRIAQQKRRVIGNDQLRPAQWMHHSAPCRQ